MSKPKTDADLIDAAGGTAFLASLCGEECNVVSNWRLRNRIPRPWKKFLQEKLPEFDWGVAVASPGKLGSAGR